MKKYVSPELNVELFNLADMIMLSAGSFNGTATSDNNDPSQHNDEGLF